MESHDIHCQSQLANSVSFEGTMSTFKGGQVSESIVATKEIMVTYDTR